jgi:hypothetical protein
MNNPYPRYAPLATLLPWLLLSPLSAQGAGPAQAPDLRLAKVHEVGRLLPESGAAREESRQTLASVASAVRFMIQPALRSDEELQVLGERWLALLGRAEQHVWLERITRGELADAMPLGQLQVQVVTFPVVQFTTDVLPALQGGDAAREVVVLESGAATAAFLQAVLSHKHAKIKMLDPALLVPLRMAATASIEQTAYVRDYEVEVTAAATIANPIVDVVEDGLRVQAMAARRDDGTLALSLHANLTDLQKPIPKFKTTAGVDAPVTIMLPEMTRVSVEAKVELRLGQVVAVAMPAVAGKQCLLLVKVAELPAAESGKPR